VAQKEKKKGKGGRATTINGPGNTPYFGGGEDVRMSRKVKVKGETSARVDPSGKKNQVHMPHRGRTAQRGEGEKHQKKSLL